MKKNKSTNKYLSNLPTEVLSFESPYFDQFKGMLINSVYHYRLNTFQCDHTLKQTKWVLNFLNLDIEKSIKFLQKNGGLCDCQVVINVNNNNINKDNQEMNNIKKEYTFEETTSLVNERDEGICQNCGDIVSNTWIVRLSGHPQEFDPDNFMLVCGRCFQQFAKRNRELVLI